MELLRSFLRNTRKPEGFLGKCMVASMNYAHAALADWGLGCLPKTGPSGLRNWAAAAAETSGPFCENTLPQLSPPWTIRKYPWKRPEISIRKNCRPAAAVSYREMFLASLSRIGHLIWQTAFETVYFWPGPTESFREVYRILRRGGSF